MPTQDGKWFAYVESLRGPSPRIFHDGINETDAKHVLIKWPLEGRAAELSLTTLKLAYPFPMVQMDESTSRAAI